MARYSKVERRTWSDEKFIALSSPPASAKFLWFYLLTNPHLTSIPGIFVSGEAMISEALGWPLEDQLEGFGKEFEKGFRGAFKELSDAGMAEADWKARVVYLPNATKYNKPENPNVIRGWEDAWHEIPECKLKLKAWQALKELTEQQGEAFAKAFLKACPKPLKGLPKGLANQEQEQEQDIHNRDKKGEAVKRHSSDDGGEGLQPREHVDRDSGETFQLAATAIPPTIEAVITYMARIMVSETEAHKFFNYYAMKGWVVGPKAPMKNWQRACQNWKLNLSNYQGSNNGNGSNNSARDNRRAREHAEPDLKL